MSLALRPYQRACVDALFSWVSAQDGNPLLVIPTGGGKSLIMGTIVGEAQANAPGTRVLIVAHRKELIAQNVKAVTTVLPLGSIGIYSAGLRKRDTQSSVIVGGIQSIAKRPYDLGSFDLVLIDEAHLVSRDDDTLYAKLVTALRIMNPHVRIVGLTATPYRLTSGLLYGYDDALFSGIAYEAGVGELIADGFLCPLISRATLVHLNTGGIAVRGGEFVTRALEEALDQKDTTDTIVDEMVATFADRNKWLVFCVSVAHAEHVAEALRERGIPTRSVHGSMSDCERTEALWAFREGKVRALTSVDVLTTGYDEPAIDAIAMMRPTKSTGLYVQMVGRGFRLHPSKTNTLILDFAGNVPEHGPVDAIHADQFRRRGEKRDATERTAPTKNCPECRLIVPAGVRTCPECSHEFPEPTSTPLVPDGSLAPVLTSEPVPIEWQEITSVEYHYHQRDDKPPSLRVEYYFHFRRIASEWICFEHQGFALKKAKQWWSLRSNDPPPDTIDEAIRLCEHDEFPKPSAIAVQQDGKYKRVVECRLPPLDPLVTLPRACWSCDFYSNIQNHCRKWDAQPPAEDAAVGCDAWKEDEIPF